MSTVIYTRSPGKLRTRWAAPARGRAAVGPADLLLPVAVALWALGVSRTHATVLGPFGLPPQLPVIFYAGVALLVVSAAIELARERPSRWRMALHTVALVVMLYATAPLVYSAGRYAWLYKTIGVVQYINANGQLNHHIDIYQNWPGFFALAAWFDKVAGVGSPLTYAKWAQLVFELAALPLLYLAYDALSLTSRQRWIALMLYPAANWIGQDYFSPQGLGTILSLGVMAIAVRWFYLGNRGRPTRRSPRAGRKPVSAPAEKEKLTPVSRQEVWEAYQAIRVNREMPGIDGVTIEDFERDLWVNLENIRNRLSTGTYIPASALMLEVERRKGTEKTRVPTVSDRIAEMVVARRLEALVKRHSQTSANGKQAANGTRGGWTIELDLRHFYDTCRHEPILQALTASTSQEWLVAYIRRWLRTPVKRPDGSLRKLSRGITRGSSMSRVLADLFFEQAFDSWMASTYPAMRVERKSEDATVFCASERQALAVRTAIGDQLAGFGLVLPPAKVRSLQVQDSLPQDSWESLPASSGRGRLGRGPQAPEAGTAVPVQPLLPPAGRTLLFAATLMLIYFVLSFTHQLSPYLVAMPLAVLAAAGLLRPRWLPLALFAIALGYLLPRFAYVNSTYGLFSGIGNFLHNAAPPTSAAGTGLPPSQHLIERCAELLSLGIWTLALVGVWRRRRSGRTVRAMIVLAFSIAFVLFIGAYGNEGILRIYLFSLPWTAALAASALAPSSGLSSSYISRRKAGERRRRGKLPRGAISAPLALGVALALFFPAFFGNDSFNYMTKTEVTTLTSFFQHARGGVVYYAADNAPVVATARYNQFQAPIIFGSGLVKEATPSIASVLAQDARQYTGGAEPAYVLISPSMISYNQAYGKIPSDSFAILRASLAKSPEWKLIVSRGGTVIYGLASNTNGTGVGGSKSIFAGSPGADILGMNG